MYIPMYACIPPTRVTTPLQCNVLGVFLFYLLRFHLLVKVNKDENVLNN